MVPPIFGPAPKTIATLPSRRFISCDHRIAPALQRHAVAALKPAPWFGRASLAHRFQLAPEDLAQERDSHVGLTKALLRAVYDRTLAHHGDVVLCGCQLQRRVLGPGLVDEQRVVVIRRIV